MIHFSRWKNFLSVQSQSSDDFIQQLEESPFKLNHECRSQNVERHIKLVTEASSSVCGYSRRDGPIRNKIRSRKLMKDFVFKKYFKVTH